MAERDNNGRFVKGLTPWNKGTRGVMKPNTGNFTKDTIVRSDYTTPRLQKRDGPVITLENEFVPVTDHRHGKTYMHHKRIPYAKYVLMQAGVTIPSGSIVYHKDGNKNNNKLSNLEVITRKELLMRNRPNKFNHSK